MTGWHPRSEEMADDPALLRYDIDGLRDELERVRAERDDATAALRALASTSESVVRTFATGANRDVDDDKLDYEAFLSPLVIAAYGRYMHENRFLRDGTVRDGDNWQKGMPLDAYMKSGWRHFMDWWMEHRGHESREGLEKALCGLLFNVCGYLHEVLKGGESCGKTRKATQL